MQLLPGKESEFAAAKEANSQDLYGACGYRYLERWADLMEAKLGEGAKLTEVAEETSHEADTEGITGFMYGLAVNTLAHFWLHGEELRKWHNKEYGYEGDGTVNPAIIAIGTK